MCTEGISFGMISVDIPRSRGSVQLLPMISCGLGVATESEVLSDAVSDFFDSASGTFGLHEEWPGTVDSLFDGQCESI